MKKNCKFGTDWDKLGSNVYSGAASFGKDYTYIMTIITILICLILLVAGSVIFFKKSVYTNQVIMTITQNSTLNNDDSGKISYTTYGTVSNCGNSITITTSEPYYIVTGQPAPTITVYQNPSNLCDVADKPVPYKMIGGVMIGFAIIIGGFSLINLFFVKKYKGVAAAEGAMGVFNLFRR
jgi:hypothetical protein